MHYAWEIFRFRLRNAVVKTARNISGRRELWFNLSLTAHAAKPLIFFSKPLIFFSKIKPCLIAMAITSHGNAERGKSTV